MCAAAATMKEYSLTPVVIHMEKSASKTTELSAAASLIDLSQRSLLLWEREKVETSWLS